MKKPAITILNIVAPLVALILAGYWLYDRYADPTFEISFSQAPQIRGEADIILETGEVASFRDFNVTDMAYVVELTNTSQKNLHIKGVLLVPTEGANGEVFSMRRMP